MSWETILAGNQHGFPVETQQGLHFEMAPTYCVELIPFQAKAACSSWPHDCNSAALENTLPAAQMNGDLLYGAVLHKNS